LTAVQAYGDGGSHARQLWLAGGAFVVLAWVAALAGRPVGTVVERLAGRELRSMLRGRVSNVPEFVAHSITEMAFLLTVTVVAIAIVAAVSVYLRRTLSNRVAALLAAVAASFVAANVVAYAASCTAIFWLALYAAGPNLKQPAFHIERLLLMSESGPTRMVIVGSSQGHSEIRASYLDEQCGNRYKFANLSFAGSSGFDFLMLEEQFRPLRPSYVLVYISPQAFFTGAQGGRLLPFLSFGTLQDARRLGLLGRLTEDDIWYGTLGMLSPLFRARRAVSDAVFGEAAGGDDEAQPDAAAAPPDRVTAVASQYRVNEDSALHMRAFGEFLERVVSHGATPIVLVGQVSPVLQARLAPAVEPAFDAFVQKLGTIPGVRVVHDGLVVHRANDYAPGDYMHVTDDARMAYTKSLVKVLQRDFGMCTQ
jgi:hypothetical protein